MSSDEMMGNSPFRHRKLLIFMFIFVFLVIGFFTFFGDLSFTGKIISGNGGSSVNASSGNLVISSQLNIPNLALKSDFERVLVVSGGSNYIELGNLKVPLMEDSEVILTGYSGRIYFNGSRISELTGKAEKVSVNGETLSSNSDGLTKVYLGGDSSYMKLEIDNLYLRNLDYTAFGVVKLNEEKIFNLNNESVYIKDFKGNVSASGKEGIFNMEGTINKLEISGASKVSVS